MANIDATTIGDKRNILPIFELPEEMRDSSYDELLVTRHQAAEEHHLALEVENLADPTASRIGKQFNAEYLNRASKRDVVIRILDHVDFYGHVTDASVPSPALRTKVAEFLLIEDST